MKNYGFLTIFAFTIQGMLALDPEVDTTNGKIRGFTQTSYNGKVVSTYLGIPFAEPPVGDLRFKRPVHVQNWTNTLECKVLPNSCPQIKFDVFVGKKGEKGEEMWNYNTNSSEDCLYLNVWSPKITSGKPLSTLVWVFGGGYIYGSSTLDLYDGAYLSAYGEVIVISMNYRVGPFGFLFMGNEGAPGNAGLLDQVIALEWVYNNIEIFGGSKNSITVFGESAGAASVSYLMASDLSKNFFQRAILQSASSLASWAYQEPDIAKRYAQNLADLVSCGNRDPDETVHCLRQVSADDLTTKTWNLKMTHVQWPFVPTIDNYFMNQNTLDMVKNDYFTNKDILFGFNTDEGTFFLLYFLLGVINYPNSSNMTRQQFLAEIPYIVSRDGFSIIDQEQDKLIFDAILMYYNALSDEMTSSPYFDTLDDIAGDFNFKCPVVELADILTRQSNRNGSLFGYYFDHRTSVSDWPEWTGVLHGDEIEYVFGVPLKSTTSMYSLNEQYLSRNMIEYWTKFAKTGHPNVQTWREFTAEQPQYAVLQGGRELYMQTIDYSRTCQFWSKYIPRLKTINEQVNMCVNRGWQHRISEVILTVTLTFPLIMHIVCNH